MGKTKAPVYNPPAPPKLQTADELFSGGTQYAQQNFPNAFGAREQALQDVNSPAYYNQWQPSSFEEAMGNQYFQNIWPDMEAYLGNALSRSGIESSPVYAETLGRERGRLGFDIGSYLSNQGNERANNSLNARLGIDPIASLIGPYANTGANQSNAQAGMDYGYAQDIANRDYQMATNKFNQGQGMRSTMATIGGGGLGFMLGGPAGAAYGAAIGSTAAPLFGGSSNPQGADMLGQMLMQQAMARPVNPSSSPTMGQQVGVFGGGVNSYSKPTTGSRLQYSGKFNLPSSYLYN